jgi:hypothetical protein
MSVLLYPILSLRSYIILTEGSGFPQRDAPTMVLRRVGNRHARFVEEQMVWGPKGSAGTAVVQCAVCGSHTELFELPGRSEKYCFECSADVATSILLTTEIDAATRSGEETAALVAEFLQLGRRLLSRAQLQ